jgi:hypothetical protein
MSRLRTCFAISGLFAKEIRATRLSAPCLALIAAASLCSTPRAEAATTATLYNASDKNVQMILKWENRPESNVIMMRPGDVMHVWSPDDGVPLSIRFNDDPGGPLIEEGRILPTLTHVPYSIAGRYSCFRNTVPGRVGLFHMDKLSQGQPVHVGQAMAIDGRLAGEVVGGVTAAVFFEGSPESIAAGANIGRVIGGGMPAFKQAVAEEMGL